MNNKFEYFLNAVHYSMWRFNDITKIPTNKLVYGVNSFIINHFVPQRKRERIYDRMNKGKKGLEYFFDNKKSGFYVLRTHHFFGFFCASYPAVISYVMVGYMIKTSHGDPNRLLLILAIAIPVIIGTIPTHKAVFNKDRYLEYYKIFEKEDARWHRKWRRIMIAFCACSIVISLAGIALMLVIAIS